LGTDMLASQSRAL